MKSFLLIFISINIFALNLCITVPSTYKDYAEELEIERFEFAELLHNIKFEKHQSDIEGYFLEVSEAFSIGNTLDEKMRLTQRNYKKEEQLKISYHQALIALDKPREYIQSLYYETLSEAIDKDDEKYVKFLVTKGSFILDSNDSIKEKVLQYSEKHKSLANSSAVRYIQDKKNLSKIKK